MEELEKLALMAVTNGYSLDELKAALSSNGFNEEQILAASDIYGLKKKEGTTSESSVGVSPSPSPSQDSSIPSPTVEWGVTSFKQGLGAMNDRGLAEQQGQEALAAYDARVDRRYSLDSLRDESERVQNLYGGINAVFSSDEQLMSDFDPKNPPSRSEIETKWKEVNSWRNLPQEQQAERINSAYQDVMKDEAARLVDFKNGQLSLVSEGALQVLNDKAQDVQEMFDGLISDEVDYVANETDFPFWAGAKNALFRMMNSVPETLQDLIYEAGLGSEEAKQQFKEQIETDQFYRGIESMGLRKAGGISEDNLEGSITEDFFVRDESGELNIGDGFKKLYLGAGEQVPQLAAMIATRGKARNKVLAGMGASAGFQSYSEMIPREDIGTGTKLLLGTVNGVAEYATERFFTSDIDLARTNLRKAFGMTAEEVAEGAGKSTFRAKTLDMLRAKSPIAATLVSNPIVRAAGDEAIEELIVETVNQTAAAILAGDEYNGYQILDAMMLGGFTGGGMVSTSMVLSKGVSAINTPILKDKINIVERIKNINSVITDPSLTSEEKATLKSELERSERELQDLVDREQKFYASMNEADQEQILSLNQQIRKKAETHSAMKTSEGKAKILSEIQGLMSQKLDIEKSYGSPATVQLNEDGKAKKKPYKDRSRNQKANKVAAKNSSKTFDQVTVEVAEDTDLNAVVSEFIGEISDQELQAFGTSRSEIAQAIQETGNMFRALKSINPDAKIYLHKTPKAFKDATGENALESPGIFLPSETGDNSMHLFVPHLAAGTAIHEVGHEIASQLGLDFVTEIFNALGMTISANDFLSDRYGSFLDQYAERGFIDKKTGKTYKTKAEIEAAGVEEADITEGVIGFDMNTIQEEFFAEFLQDLARGMVDVKIQKSLWNKIRAGVNDKFGTTLSTGDTETQLVEVLSKMAQKLAKGQDIFDEAYQISEIMEDGLGISAIDATQVDPVSKKRKSQFLTSSDVNTYQMKDVLDRVGGRMIVITSDNTGVGMVNEKFIQGGLFYSFLPENVRDGVGFASVDIKSVKTVMTFINEIAPNGEDVAVFIMQQKPEAMLGNFYAADYFSDAIIEVVPADQITEFIKDFDATNATSKGVMKTLKKIPTKPLDRSGKEIAPDKEFGYGKRMGNDIYMEASFMEDMPPFVSEAAKLLPADFEFKIVKFNTKTQTVSFIQSPDFDTAFEPTVGDSIRVMPDGSMKRTAGRVTNKQIYHHKWTMVRPTNKDRGWGAKNNYKGFNYSESVTRSILMQEIMLKLEDTKASLKIGNEDFWSSSVLPQIESLYTADGQVNWSLVGTWKKGQEAAYKNFVNTLEKGKLTKAQLSQAIDKMSFKFRNEVIKLHLPTGMKGSDGKYVHFKDTSREIEPQGSLIKKALSKGNKNQAQFYTKYSQPNFASEAEIIAQLNGDWGYVYSGFITSGNLDYGKEFQENSGVTHEQFNAKIPSKENFLLDAGYEIDQRFKGKLEYKDSDKQPTSVKVSISGSMFMGTRTAKAKATVVNMFNAELGGEKAGLTTKDVVEGLAKKRKKVPSNKITPSVEGSWYVSRGFDEVLADHPDLYKDSLDEEAEASGVGNETQVTTNNGTYQKMIDFLRLGDPDYKNKVFADINGGLGASNQLKYENGIANYQVIEPFYDRRRFPIYTMTNEDAVKAVGLLGLKVTDKPHTELNKFVKSDEGFAKFESLVKRGQLPSSKLTPDYTEQNGYDIPSESVDYAMSNAVLNVIPGDVRQDVVLNFGRALKVGGKGLISTRAKDVATNKSNISLSEDPLEFYVAQNYSYQKGFTNKELQAYVQDVLGTDFRVSVYAKLSGSAVLVERVSNNEDLESKFVFKGAKARKLNTKAVYRSVTFGVRGQLKALGYSSRETYNYGAKEGDGAQSWYHHLYAENAEESVGFIFRTADHNKGNYSISEKGHAFDHRYPYRSVYSSSDAARKEWDTRNAKYNLDPDKIEVINIFDHDSYKKVVSRLVREGYLKEGSIETGFTDWDKFFSRKVIVQDMIDAYNGMEVDEYVEMLQGMGFSLEDAIAFSNIMARESEKQDADSPAFAANLFTAITVASKKGNDATFLSRLFRDIDIALEDGQDLDALFDKYEQRIKGSPKTRAELMQRLEKLKKNLAKQLIDRQFNVKLALQEAGFQMTEDLLVTVAGSSGWAKLLYNQYEKGIYGNLSNAELKILDQIIFARRVIQIDTNFDNRGVERPKHPSDFTKEKAEGAIKKLSMTHGAEMVADMNKRADAYFDAMRDQFQQAYDAGLISEAAYEALRNDDYIPRKFLYFVLNPEDNTFREGSNVKEFIKELKSGSIDDLILDSRYLLQIHVKQTQEKIFKNRLVASLAAQVEGAELGSLDWAAPANTKEVPVGEMMNLAEPGEEDFFFQPEKSIVTAPDKGFVNMYYFKGGELAAVQVTKQIRDEFLDLEILGRSEQFGAVGNVLKGINTITRMNATGAGNPLFFLKDFFRNWQFALFRSDVYGRDSFTLSSFRLFKDLFSATADKVLLRDEYMDLASHGGLMDFLSTEANPYKNLAVRKGSVLGWTKKQIGRATQGLTYMSETTEIAFRVAIYKRDLQQRIQEFISENGHEPDAEQLEGLKFAAARSAREVLDFSQGGLASKDIDRYIKPYFNVAVQGARGIVGSMQRDPVKFFRYAAEMGVLSAAITYVRLATGDEEDEENLSEYFKKKYFIFWNGDKKEDGSRDFIAIPKAEQIGGFMRVAEMMVEKEIKGEGAFSNWTSEDWRDLAGSFSMFLPITGITDFAPPILQSYIAYNGNWDMFRDAVVTSDFDKTLPGVEGIDDKRVEYFYKAFGDATGVSPARAKAAGEKLYTTPGNSVFVSLAYNFADFIARKTYDIKQPEFKGQDIVSKSKELDMSVLVEAFNPKTRFYKTTNPKAKFYIEDLKAKEIELREGTEFKSMKMFISDLSERFLTGEIDLKQAQVEITESIAEDDLRKKAFSFLKSSIRREETQINAYHWDVYSSSSAELQAYYLVKHFKNLEDIEQEMGKMKAALGYRPTIGVKEEVEKLLKQVNP
jgi:phage host-nuclease inhibitor protein Gam